MAVTFDEIPDAFALTRDPLIYKLTGENYVSTAGVKYYTLVVFEDTPFTDVGDEFRLDSNILDQDPYKAFEIVTATPSWVPDGETLRAPLSGESLEDYIDNVIIPGLMSWPLLYNNYEVFRVGSDLAFQAREYGSDYNMVILSSGISLLLSDTVNGVNQVLESDYRIRVRCNMETEHNSGLFNQSPWFYLWPAEDGSVEIDLSEKADELFGDPGKTDPWRTQGAENKSAIRRFFIEAAEHYGATPDENPSSISSKIRLMKGSVRNDSSPAQFYSHWVVAKSFLTPRGMSPVNNMKAFPADKFAMYFINLLGNPLDEVVLLNAKVYYTDGSSATTTCYTLTDCDEDQLWEVQAGFNALGLNALNPSLTPYKYELWVQTNTLNLILAEKKMIELLDLSVFFNYVGFRNRFGLWESIAMEGAGRQVNEVSRSDIYSGRNEDLKVSENTSFNLQATPVIELSSGPFNEYDTEVIVDISMSDEHWVSRLGRGYTETLLYGATLMPDDYLTKSFDTEGGHYQAVIFKFKLNRLR